MPKKGRKKPGPKQGGWKRDEVAERWARSVIEHLNSGEGASQRICKLICDMHDMNASRAEKAELETKAKALVEQGPYQPYPLEAEFELNRERFDALMDLIDTDLKPYVGHPKVRGVIGRKYTFGLAEQDNSIPAKEWRALESVMNLAREGKLDHVRQCIDCGTWMFVKFPYGKRPQVRCRTCSAEWRKGYMPRHRERLKARDEAQRRLLAEKSRARNGGSDVHL